MINQSQLWIEATGRNWYQFLAFPKNVRVKIPHILPSSISWKVEFEIFWMNSKAWLNVEVFLLPLKFTFEKCLTISSGVLVDACIEIELQMGSLRGAIMIKIKNLK